MKEKWLDFDKLLAVKPGNESEEHFILKQVGRAFLWQVGCRAIATEVGGLYTNGRDEVTEQFGYTYLNEAQVQVLEQGTCPLCKAPLAVSENEFVKCYAYSLRLDGVGTEAQKKCRASFWKDDQGWKYRKKGYSFHRNVIDVLGIGKRYVELESSKARRKKRNKVWRDVVAPVQKSKKFSTMSQAEWRTFLDEVAEAHGLRVYDLLTSTVLSRPEPVFKGVEAKATLQDFRSGFCMFPDYTYVIAPKGIVPVVEVPKSVGLLEVDLAKVSVKVSPVVIVHGLKIAKKPRFSREPSLQEPEGLDQVVQNVLRKIAQQNTQEVLFWNGV